MNMFDYLTATPTKPDLRFTALVNLDSVRIRGIYAEHSFYCQPRMGVSILERLPSHRGLASNVVIDLAKRFPGVASCQRNQEYNQASQRDKNHFTFADDTGN